MIISGNLAPGPPGSAIFRQVAHQFPNVGEVRKGHHVGDEKWLCQCAGPIELTGVSARRCPIILTPIPGDGQAVIRSMTEA